MSSYLDVGDKKLKTGISFLSKLKKYLIFAGIPTFIFLSTTIASFVYGIYLTFTNWNGLSKIYSFVGLENYISAFKDAEFMGSLWLTLQYVLVVVVLTNVISFLLAFLLTKGIRGRNFFKASFFAPNLIGGIILGFIWNFIFSQVLVNLGEMLHIGIFSSSWLAAPDTAFWALVIVSVWQLSGYMMIIYTAGLMNIPEDLLEAASIDGAEGFVKVKKIVLPLMVPSFTICIFLTLQRAFTTYDMNLTLTSGGPYNSTQLIAMHVFNKAFISEQYGVGQAEALFLFLIVAAVTMIQVYFSKKLEVEA
jgi:raffinose/stachyose/melibiose transport system permease protein